MTNTCESVEKPANAKRYRLGSFGRIFPTIRDIQMIREWVHEDRRLVWRRVPHQVRIADGS
jgi:hypothetical protein